MTPFVGRQLELAVLAARLAAAVAGDPQVVLVEGPPGIGKTTLVERFVVTAAESLVVLRAGGEETESLLAYGVLEQMARSAGAAGLELFSAVTADPVPDPVTVGTKVLELLDKLDGPVVLIVDDAHWADIPSIRALIFALRRLVADPVMALFTTRGDEEPENLRRLVTGHLGSVLRLRGLDEEDLREFARQLGMADLGPTEAQRLRYGTQGNPLHVRALLEEFPPSRWGPEEVPLPSPRSFRKLVQDRMTGCAATTRALVEASAVLGGHCPLPLAAALAQVGDPLLALDGAVRAELLVADESRSPWTLTSPHPLVRAAVYDSLGPARRHALHVAAASGVADEAESLRHRVAAASEPDEELAGDLTRFAAVEAQRHAWHSATGFLMSASRLSPVPDEARRRFLRAVEWMLLRGDAVTAATFAAEVAAAPPGPLRDSVLGLLATTGDDPHTAQRLLVTAWNAVDPDTEPDTAAVIATVSAMHRYGRLDAAGTISWCERALALAAPGTVVRTFAQTYLLHGLGYAGRAQEAAAACAVADDGAEHVWLNPRGARGLLRMVDDDLDGARADFGSVATTAARLGVLNTSAFAFAYLARAEWMAGDWDNSVVHAERAMAINLQSDVEFLQAAVAGIAVLVPAARGEWDVAAAHLDSIRATGYERSVLGRAMAQARVGEARGDAAAVLTALDPVRRFVHRDGTDEPGFWPWQDLYADALTRSGRVEEADAFLVEHEQRAADRGRRTSIARLARARGLLEASRGNAERAEAAFAQALEVTEDLHVPFERARIELAAGSVLRRAGRRRRAAELLSLAADRFTELGARPYAERCAKELAASGLHPVRRSTRDRAELTAQELVVARLAAAGQSNRDIADELVVSIKTIEYHLRNAFAKLGITSRRQLAGQLD